MTKAAYPTIGIAAFVVLVMYFIGCLRLFKLSALKSELEELFGTTVDLLRMRKQLDGTILKDSVMKDLIYV